jgi:hypothetical protein
MRENFNIGNLFWKGSGEAASKCSIACKEIRNPFLFIKNKLLIALEKNSVICSQRAILLIQSG